MTFMPFVHFFCVITYLYVGGYILIKGYNETLNRAGSALFLSIAIWSFGKIFVQDPGASQATARFFENIASIGWLSFSIFLLYFVLIFTGREKVYRSLWLAGASLTFFAVFSYLQWTGRLLSGHALQWYGWSNVWGRGIAPYVFYIFYFAYVLGALITLYYFDRATLKPIKKIQAKILFVTFLVCLLFGTVMDVVLPKLNRHAFPELSDVLALLVAFGVLYAIVRYKFLAITPATAADNIVSNMSDALILLNPDGKIEDINYATSNLLSYKKNELVGRPVLDLLADSDVDEIGAGFPNYLRASNVRDLDMTFKTRDGIERPVSFSSSRLSDEEGGLAGMVCIARDVTASRRMEQELRSANEDLRNKEEALLKVNESLQKNEKAVLNILADLKKSHDELQDSQEQLLQQAKLASLGKLVSDMAHEVNNPLQVISGRAQISLLEDVGNRDLEENLRIIKDQCERARDIIQRLLLFSKPSKGELKEVDANESIAFVVKLIRHQLEIENVHIVEEYGASLPKIKIDDKQMHEVFMNLVKNAAEAMPDGGTITISTAAEGDNIRIAFRDTGEGISEEALKKIFDPFFTTKEKGTGLGLSVCYGIVNSHGGELRYTSEPGKGTTATITLPAAGKQPSGEGGPGT